MHVLDTAALEGDAGCLLFMPAQESGSRQQGTSRNDWIRPTQDPLAGPHPAGSTGNILNSCHLRRWLLLGLLQMLAWRVVCGVPIGGRRLRRFDLDPLGCCGLLGVCRLPLLRRPAGQPRIVYRVAPAGAWRRKTKHVPCSVATSSPDTLNMPDCNAATAKSAVRQLSSSASGELCWQQAGALDRQESEHCLLRNACRT